jgi:stage III sporulation protein AE
VGNTFGSLADTVVGSGILIKSAVGVGGVICIGILCFYPLLKIIVFTIMYRVGSAVLQPVSDRRMVAAMQAAGESGKLLLGFVFAGTLLFVFSIIIVLFCSNCFG